MVNGIAKFIVALNGNRSKTQIAAGWSWGILLGLVPPGNLLWVVLFIVSFFFTHHHGSKLVILILIKLFFPFIAPQLDIIGWEILHIEALEGFYRTLYNTPFVLFTRFNNTLVAGGFIGGIVLFIPVFLLVVFTVPGIRAALRPKIAKSSLTKSLLKIPVLSKLHTSVTVLSSEDNDG
jgi:uncharacterized protein (TIGR03546 family)